MSGPLLLSVALFVVLTPLGGATIPWLLRRGIGKRIRSDGPEAHRAKAGTATMGGLLFVCPAILVGLGLVVLGHREVIWPVLAAGAFGALGAFDDLQGLRDRQGVGWLARYKFPWQWGVGLALALALSWSGMVAPLHIPLWNRSLQLAGWAIPLGAVLLVGFANAVNLTDGLDGLAGGVSALVLAVLALGAGLQGQVGLTYWSMALLGGVLAFLWHNVHPARVFMGDVGSQALGASLAMLALLSGHTVTLLIVGAVCVAEALSVMLQVGYFKYTRRRYGEGRRILRMTPLHHHFELSGWNEVQVTLRFWLVTAVAGLLALAVARVGGPW